MTRPRSDRPSAARRSEAAALLGERRGEGECEPGRSELQPPGGPAPAVATRRGGGGPRRSSARLDPPVRTGCRRRESSYGARRRRRSSSHRWRRHDQDPKNRAGGKLRRTRTKAPPAVPPAHPTRRPARRRRRRDGGVRGVAAGGDPPRSYGKLAEGVCSYAARRRRRTTPLVELARTIWDVRRGPRGAPPNGFSGPPPCPRSGSPGGRDTLRRPSGAPLPAKRVSEGGPAKSGDVQAVPQRVDVVQRAREGDRVEAQMGCREIAITLGGCIP